MNNLLWSLALSCLLAPPVEKSDDATTHLYVRTSPAGAEIVLDGKSLGKSPGVFPVESGQRPHRLVIELDGHIAEDQKITIRDGRVTRIELTLKPRPEAPRELPDHFQHRKVGKKIADFPEAVDLSTPESAWAAYTRASGGKDAQGVVDLSWVKIDPREMEKFWTTGRAQDMAVYNRAQLESELIEVIVYRDKLATTISKLAFPPGVGRDPFSQRAFGLIDGKWKNLGENRCPSQEAAAAKFTERTERAESIWSKFQETIAKQSGYPSPAAWPPDAVPPNAVLRTRKIGKKVSDFPEPIDLSTPETAWAAYHRASGSQDVEGMLDLSWQGQGPRRIKAKQGIEESWTKRNPKELAAYNKAQLDAELIEIVFYRDKLAMTISRLEFPPGVGQDSFSQRIFSTIDGKWKSMGEVGCSSLEAAVNSFPERDALRWRGYVGEVLFREGQRALHEYLRDRRENGQPIAANMLQPDAFNRRKVSKKVTDFPEAVDLFTPESAWAAYTRASSGQDAQGVVDLSWVKIDPREMEKFWTTGKAQDMAVYSRAQLDSELVEVFVYRDKLATTISKLAFPPGVGQDRFSQRVFGLIDGKWKNLGENRCPSQEAAAAKFTERAESIWSNFQETMAEERTKSAPDADSSIKPNSTRPR